MYRIQKHYRNNKERFGDIMIVLGDTVVTKGIFVRMEEDKDFMFGVGNAMGQFQNEDWGVCSEEDKMQNDYAVAHNDTVLGAYLVGEEKIWIIRDPQENGKYLTTILFPDEY